MKTMYDVDEMSKGINKRPDKKINWTKIWYVFQAILLVLLLLSAIGHFVKGNIEYGFLLLIFTQMIITGDNVRHIMNKHCKCKKCECEKQDKCCKK